MTYFQIIAQLSNDIKFILSHKTKDSKTKKYLKVIE